MDKRIFTFDEASHTYTDDKNFAYTSVTTCTGKYKPVFDAKGNARRLAREGQGHYAGMTEKEILKSWEKITDHALDKGNARHDYLENGVKTSTGFKEEWNKIKKPRGRIYTLADIKENHKYGLVDLDLLADLIGVRYPKVWEAIKWYVDRDYKFYSEIVVYDTKHLISGMIDLMAIHSSGKFVIIDWKTNKHDIVFKSGYWKKDKEKQYTGTWIDKREYMLAPLDSIENCNGNQYAMQLSTYARLAENFGFKYEYMILTHIREHYQLNAYGRPIIGKDGMFIPIPELGERVEFHSIPYYKAPVENMMNHHYNKTIGNYGMQFKIY
jgi:hypothetical protein